jgi:hypothetical protein
MDLSVAHDQYPFDLPGNENQWNVMEEIIALTLGEEAAATCRETADMAYDCDERCSASNLLNFQHIFAEFPAVIARQTDQIILRNEKPASYGYRWADITDATVISDCSTK